MCYITSHNAHSAIMDSGGRGALGRVDPAMDSAGGAEAPGTFFGCAGFDFWLGLESLAKLDFFGLRWGGRIANT